MKKPPSEPIYGNWITLDWYDGPLSEIALIQWPEDDYGPHRMVEIKTIGGWQGEVNRTDYEGNLVYENHMRFTRHDLQMMLDLIDGKPVKGYND